MPKTELVQKFHVLYLGMTSVSRPIGKNILNTEHSASCRNYLHALSHFSDVCVSSSGMDIINGAIDNLRSSTGKEDWTPVVLSIADTTVAVIKEKARDSLLLSGELTNNHRMSVHLLVRERRFRSLIVCAGRGGGAVGGVPRSFLVFHGRGTGRAHICLHYGHW